VGWWPIGSPPQSQATLTLILHAYTEMSPNAAAVQELQLLSLTYEHCVACNSFGSKIVKPDQAT
jgi:hypothetical protein